MLLTLILSAVLIGLDQWLKALAVRYLAPIGTKVLVPGVIGLRYVENDGAAFGLLNGRQGFLIAVTGIALLVVAGVLLLRRPKGKLEYLGLVMVFAGGVGNLIDRIANGYVVDYIELLFVNFAVFNFADMLVCVGFAILAVMICRAEWQASKAKKAQADGPDEPDAPNTDEAAGEDGPAKAENQPDG